MQALRRCERRFAATAAALRGIVESARADPEPAGARALALAGGIVDELCDASELNIRLLDAAACDRPTAHAVNVAIVALLMGRNFGLERDELADLGTGALLHDVGALGLAEPLRRRDPRFSSADAELWREHVAHGVALGARMRLEPAALQVIEQHHEQADGGGFPKQLNVDRMSVLARIVALVDRFDDLVNPPLADAALTPHDALSLLFARDQQHHDATMLAAFIRMMGVYPPGSAVQLTDGRYGLVVSVNSTRPLKPRLLLYDPAAGAPPLLDLETVPGLGIRRSLKPAQLPPPALRQLAPRSRMRYGFEPAGRNAAQS